MPKEKEERESNKVWNEGNRPVTLFLAQPLPGYVQIERVVGLNFFFHLYSFGRSAVLRGFVGEETFLQWFCLGLFLFQKMSFALIAFLIFLSFEVLCHDVQACPQRVQSNAYTVCIKCRVKLSIKLFFHILSCLPMTLIVLKVAFRKTKNPTVVYKKNAFFYIYSGDRPAAPCT